MRLILGLREHDGSIMRHELEVQTYELRSGWAVLYLNDCETIVLPSDLVHAFRVINTDEGAVSK